MEKPNDVYIAELINDLYNELVRRKPGDRSERDRLWAIAKTDLEKLQAYWIYKVQEA